jgi:hypothetical protein
MEIVHMKNFVYVMGAATGPQKIGIAGNVARRLRSIQTGSHVPIVLAFSAETEGDGVAEKVENYAHWLLREKRLHGEWFDVTPSEARTAVNNAVIAVANGEKIEKLVRNVGRKKLWEIRLTLPISTEMLEEIDASLEKDEARLDMIRAAIDRELKRRRRKG